MDRHKNKQHHIKFSGNKKLPSQEMNIFSKKRQVCDPLTRGKNINQRINLRALIIFPLKTHVAV